MHEQWISAWDAFRIPSLYSTIFTRLHAGLIRAKAKRLFVGPKRYDDQEIMPDFWWAEGHEALDQNWQSGDFSTWIDQKVHLRAFGVTFELAGILDALPAEERAGVARGFSVAGNEDWLPTDKAVDFIQRNSKLERGRAMCALIEQAGFGFVASRAVLARLSTGVQDTGQWVWQQREWDVPPDFWLGFSSVNVSAFSTETGNISADACNAAGGNHLSLMGVHFLVESIAAIWPPAKKSPVTPGGRPPATFHDDLMCAIWKQIFENDLKPRKQADIEKALLAWVESKGHEMSESAAREKAKKIWNSIKADA
jgi:hypothetical protein